MEKVGDFKNYCPASKFLCEKMREKAEGHDTELFKSEFSFKQYRILIHNITLQNMEKFSSSVT